MNKVRRFGIWTALAGILVIVGAVCVPVAAAQEPFWGTVGSEDAELSQIVLQTVSGGPIYVVNSDGSELRELVTGMDPALSPDGRQVAFTRWDDTQIGSYGSLWVINTDGSGERMLLDGIRQPKSPTWSPDASRIVLATQDGGRLDEEDRCGSEMPGQSLKDDPRVVVGVDDDGGVDVELCYTLLPNAYWDLRVVEVETGDSVVLPHGVYSSSPDWDPVNEWHLVYDSGQGLASLDIDQGSSWAVTDDSDDHSPVISPDGSQIAVSHWQHDHWEIHLINVDGSGRLRLTETPLQVVVEQRLNGEEQRSWNNVSPVWSPDGSRIAFLSDRNGDWEVWVMETDGSQQQKLFAASVLEGLGLQHLGVEERVLSWQ